MIIVNGHKFAENEFTIRGHGDGFWDRPEVYGKQDAEILNKIARGFRFPDYYAADGKIYCL